MNAKGSAVSEANTRLARDYAALDDAALVVCVRAGEREAFRQVMQRCNQRLYRVVRGVLDDEAEIEDVMQEAYLKVFEKIETFRGASSLATWISRIAINEAIQRLRRRHPTVDIDNLDNAASGAGSVVSLPLRAADGDPAAAVARDELHRLLERAVATLPPTFRSVFLLRDVEGCSTEETAELLAIRSETVKTRLHRARQLLQSELRERAEAALGGTFPFLGRRCSRVTDAVLARLDGHFPANT